MPNLLKFNDPPFYSFLREERQFCAVLAHLLMQPGPNLSRLMEFVNQGAPVADRIGATDLNEAEIYVEFAYLRDFWNRWKWGVVANDLKRSFIRDALGRLGIAGKLNIDFEAEPGDFNVQFIAGSTRTIRADIASPHHWSVSQLDKLAGGDNEAFRSLCKFKWSFNIKPDLVIVLPGPRAIRVEAKLESLEGSYPTKPDETGIFDRRFGSRQERVRQVGLQEFMFRQLLQVPTRQVVIAQRPAVARKEAGEDAGHIVALTWSNVLKAMDTSNSSAFVPTSANGTQHSSPDHHDQIVVRLPSSGCEYSEPRP